MEHSDISPQSEASQAHDPTRPTISIPIDNKGTLLKRNLVISSAVKNPSSLISGLTALLHRPNPPTDNPHPTATPYWTLEPTNDAITRIFTFETEEQAHLFGDQIKAVSDEMDHHARVRLESHVVTITCTTRRPAGLSMRDVRLAEKVDEWANALA